jgi:hypothetical protein
VNRRHFIFSVPKKNRILLTRWIRLFASALDG